MAEYGGKGALNYLPIVPKAFVYVSKVMRKPVMGGNTACLRLSRTCFSSEVCAKFRKLAAQTANLEVDS